MGYPFAVLTHLLLACSAAVPTDSAATATTFGCDVSDAPVLTIGTGNPVVALDDGASADLVTGPQGGHHIELGLLADGLDASTTLEALFVGLSGEDEVARALPRLDFVCDASSGTRLARNILLIFNEDVVPSALDGQTVHVEASVTDAAGRAVVDGLDLVVRDRTGAAE